MCMFPGASIVNQKVCNDFLPAKNKHVKLHIPHPWLINNKQQAVVINADNYNSVAFPR